MLFESIFLSLTSKFSLYETATKQICQLKPGAPVFPVVEKPGQSRQTMEESNMVVMVVLIETTILMAIPA